MPIQFTSGPDQDFHPAWSPGSDRLAFVSMLQGRAEIKVAPIRLGERAGDPVCIADGFAAATYPSWSPDGSQIAFLGAAGDRYGVWLVPSDGSEPATLLTEEVDAGAIRWDAATGSILASATQGATRRSLWAISAETGDVKPMDPEVVFGTIRSYGLFNISPEGRWLVLSRENLEGDIWVSEGPPGLF